MRLLCSNESPPPQPTTLIFANTTEIALTAPLTNTALAAASFTYSAPTEAKYIVFGIFTAEIQTAGKTITNSSAFLAGNREGITDFVRGSQATSKLHAYNATTKDFATANFSLPNGTYYWAVWGFDEYGAITHSSPQRKVTIP